MKEKPSDGVRLDKWLWAARFYKTRALAREMIDGGKVHYNGQRSKPRKPSCFMKRRRKALKSARRPRWRAK